MKRPIFILLMILIPHIAHAENAWVLWERTETGAISEFKSFWKILDAFATYGDCKKAQTETWTTRKNSVNRPKKEDVKINIVSEFPFKIERIYGDTIRREEFLCLPETVNPNLFEKREE